LIRSNSRAGVIWAECLGWLFLALLTVFFLVTSWRKWPDALIDFGHDLYIPWRLTQGSLLYRDIDDIYGPLSQYVNAAIFRRFGTSMMVLELANIVVFIAILIVIYVLFRAAWGKFAAFFSSAIFIAVFGFSQFISIGNYNYAAPYSHEATHGMLVCVLLLLALARWVERPTLLGSFLAGALFGLTAVLKAEFMLAGGLITLAAVVMCWRYGKTVSILMGGSWAAAAVMPTLGFAIFFSAYLPWKQALANSCSAWLNVISTTRFTADPVQIGFLGLDRPGQNLLIQTLATIFAAAIIAIICWAAWLADRSTRHWERVVLSGLLVACMAWVSIFGINWIIAGRCLLGLTALYILVSVLLPQESELPIRTLRLMIALLAAVLMGRMFLYGRIFQFGFCQAALAGLLVPAVVLRELPVRLGFKEWGKKIVLLGGLALFTPGLMILAGQSQHFLKLKTLSIGTGGDRYYAFPEQIEPTGEMVRKVTEWLAQLPGKQTLVVLPEGEMINYLVRMPNPVPPFIFYSAATIGSRGERVVRDLERHPPDWVVIISRDLREYEIQRYGEAPGKGEEIMGWAMANYEPAVSFGGDPLDNQTHGAIILRRKNPPLHGR
jgi:hypothetical protein